MHEMNPMILIRAQCGETWSGFTQGLTEDEPQMFNSRSDLFRRIFEYYEQMRNVKTNNMDFKASSYFAGKTKYSLVQKYIGFWLEIFDHSGGVLSGRILYKGQNIPFDNLTELSSIIETEYETSKKKRL